MRQVLMSMVLTLFFSTGAIAAGFSDNGNGTITDTGTTLMWQQCSAGLSGASCNTGTAGTYTWESAISYCEGLSLGGFTNWRLPNFKELKSIADMTKYSPAINATYFPFTQSSYYWSSTTFAGYTTLAWIVDFGYGGVSDDYKTGGNYVRCVR